jgi:hypothetical protein
MLARRAIIFPSLPTPGAQVRLRVYRVPNGLKEVAAILGGHPSLEGDLKYPIQALSGSPHPIKVNLVKCPAGFAFEPEYIQASVELPSAELSFCHTPRHRTQINRAIHVLFLLN